MRPHLHGTTRPDVSGPSRRATLRLAAGAAVIGASGLLSTRRAHASTCTDDCLHWQSQCYDWCDLNDTSEACFEACNSNAQECQDCCAEGGSPSECVPPSPPSTDNLVAWANALAVSVELGYSGSEYGMLRARSGSPGPWEKIDVLQLNSTDVALRSRANNLYVSAEIGYGTSNPLYGMLRARSSSIGAWETFSIGHIAESTHGSYQLVAVNDMYVSAEVGYGTSNPLYGMLRARSSSLGTWEKYNIIPIKA